jgi:hypothetical protein
MSLYVLTKQKNPTSIAFIVFKSNDYRLLQICHGYSKISKIHIEMKQGWDNRCNNLTATEKHKVWHGGTLSML